LRNDCRARRRDARLRIIENPLSHKDFSRRGVDDNSVACTTATPTRCETVSKKSRRRTSHVGVIGEFDLLRRHDNTVAHEVVEIVHDVVG
jgi:hypothetical protein